MFLLEVPWIEQVLQDMRHAYRSLSKSLGFAAVAMLSLALGIGVNTAIFTLVNGILLKRLPLPDADRASALRSRQAASSVARSAGDRNRSMAAHWVEPGGYWPRSSVVWRS